MRPRDAGVHAEAGATVSGELAGGAVGRDVERASMTRTAASNCALVNPRPALREAGRVSSEGLVWTSVEN